MIASTVYETEISVGELSLAAEHLQGARVTLALGGGTLGTTGRYYWVLLGGSARKGYLFQASGIKKGRDFTS